MSKWLQLGVAGETGSAVLRLYLYGALIVTPFVSAVTIFWGVDAAFAVTPFLVLALVVLQFSWLRISAVWPSTQSRYASRSTAQPLPSRGVNAYLDAVLGMLGVTVLVAVFSYRHEDVRIAEIVREFEVGLTTSDWTIPHLEHMQSLLSELEQFDAEQAAAERFRLNDVVAKSVKPLLTNPSIQLDKVDYLTRVLRRLDPPGLIVLRHDFSDYGQRLVTARSLKDEHLESVVRFIDEAVHRGIDGAAAIRHNLQERFGPAPVPGTIVIDFSQSRPQSGDLNYGVFRPQLSDVNWIEQDFVTKTLPGDNKILGFLKLSYRLKNREQYNGWFVAFRPAQNWGAFANGALVLRLDTQIPVFKVELKTSAVGTTVSGTFVTLIRLDKADIQQELDEQGYVDIAIPLQDFVGVSNTSIDFERVEQFVLVFEASRLPEPYQEGDVLINSMRLVKQMTSAMKRI